LVACGGDGSSGSTSSTYLTLDYSTNGLTYPPSGASGHDSYAAGGDDTINPSNGTHFIDGGTGIDTVVYIGAKSNYTITKLPNGQYATGKPDGSTDTLNSVEILQFSGGEQVTIATSDSDTQYSSTATDWLKSLAQTVIWF